MRNAYERDEHAAEWTLWSCVLAPAMFWMLQFGARYILVPWVCKTGHRWVLWAADAASLLIALGLFVHAVMRWQGVRRNPPLIGNTSSHPFLAAIGVGSGALFFAAVLVQVVAHLFIEPCQ